MRRSRREMEKEKGGVKDTKKEGAKKGTRKKDK